MKCLAMGCCFRIEISEVWLVLGEAWVLWRTHGQESSVSSGWIHPSHERLIAESSGTCLSISPAVRFVNRLIQRVNLNEKRKAQLEKDSYRVLLRN